VLVEAPLQPVGELAGEALALHGLLAVRVVDGLRLVARVHVGVEVVRSALLVLELLAQIPLLGPRVRREQPRPARVGHQNPQSIRHDSSSYT
jgi:hypothetical protein